MELVRFLRELAKRWRLLLFVPVIALLITFFLTAQMPKKYKANAQLAAGIVDDSKVSLDETKELMSSFLIQTKFSNLIELLESKTVFNLVSYHLLHHDLTGQVPFRMTAQYATGITASKKSEILAGLEQYLATGAAMSRKEQWEVAAWKLIKELNYRDVDIKKLVKVEREGNSDFIRVEAEAESAELAAFIANTICEQFLKFYLKIRLEKNLSSIDFFERLAREKKAELDKRVDELKSYKMENKIFNLYEQTKSIVNQISNLEIIREGENKKIPSLAKAVSDIEKHFTGKEKSFIEAGLTPYNVRISLLKEKVTELNMRIIGSNYSDERLKDSLAVVKRELYETVKQVSDNMILDPNVPKQELVLKKLNYEIEQEIAAKSVESIDKELRRLKTTVEKFTPAEAMISSFEREINVVAEAYLVILNKLTYAKLAAESGGENIQITQRAIPPETAEPSKRAIFIFLAGIGSFVLTIIVIMLILYLDLTVRTPKQFVQRSGIDLLGISNKISADKLDLRALFTAETVKSDEHVFKDLLRTTRQHFLEAVPSPSIVLFTGNHSYEGKTTLAICLAFSLRMLGKKILLCDTNFKSPGFTTIFSAAPKLEEAAIGNALPAESISKTSLQNIDVLGCRGSTITPDELRGSSSLQELLVSLKREYDYVFIEGSSLLRYSDSKELSCMSDKVILVFPANTTINEDDENSFRYLKSLGEKFVGAIFNKVLQENLEGVYGEAEKERSKFRKWLKAVLRRNFSRLNNGKKMKVTSE